MNSFSESTELISSILACPFAFWPNFEVPRLPLIAQDLLSPITEYNNMYLSGNKNYNPKAHEVLINMFCFYCDKMEVKQ